MIEPKLTPMMVQYKQLKEEAQDALLLFRMGDFYEAFYEDALLLSECCSLTLTKRGDVPMSGIPWHSAEGHIDRLTKAGYRVALAEQIEAPQKGVALVRRKIVRTITPGSATAMVPEKENQYIASLTQIGSILGLALCDLTTAECKVVEFEDQKSLIDELHRIRPKEILSHKKMAERHESLFKEMKTEIKSALVLRSAEWFDHKQAYAVLSDHFKVAHLDGLGLKAMVSGINAAGALLHYLKRELLVPTDHIRTMVPYYTAQFLSIDKTSQRHLELTEPLYSDRKETLFTFLDRCQTAMGARMLRNWIKQPLLCIETIQRRQEAIEKLLFLPSQATQLKGYLKQVKDLMRLMMKVSAKWASPSEVVLLRTSLDVVAPIKELLLSLRTPLFTSLADQLIELTKLTTLLHTALHDEPTEGHLFKKGYHPKLDELSHLSQNSKELLANYQERLRDESGAKTLKINYNKIFGYYIDVSKKQASLLGEEFILKQTLVNHDRFTTTKLKEIEEKLLTAGAEQESLEKQLFSEVLEAVNSYFDPILKIAEALSQLDALLSLAICSYEYGWTRPIVHKGHLLQIIGGAHPIVSAKMGAENFIPNDIVLDGDEAQLMLLTGPNMAGKSTYIRQVALLVIMAQMGCFIPAKEAHIGIMDHIFTRMGASDDLARGQSTFMVEMAECAHILHHATPRSLVILDEVGRGTSTYDGLAIAWSIVEYLLQTDDRRAKTLFATHYFELTSLEGRIPGLVNYHASVEELDDQITFLYKIYRGYATRSYAIHVAKLAHMPPSVISRAQQILTELEEKQPKVWSAKQKEKKHPQLTLFDI